MSNLSQKLVLVVDAGPTGLTMALALVKSGVKVRIIDESTAQHDAARGTAIVPRTQELLAILGAAKDLIAVATGPLPMAVYGPDGKTILKAFEWSESAQASPTIPFNILASISQAEVEKILRRHLKTYGCEVELGKKLVGITQEDNSVRAKVLLVETSSETEIECEYLVAADGRSRHFIGVSFLGETKAANRMWAANVEVPGFSRGYWHRWGDFAQAACDSSSFYFFIQLTPHRTSLKPINPGSQFQMQSLGPNLSKEIPQDLAGSQELFNLIAKRDDLVFTSVRWITEWNSALVFEASPTKCSSLVQRALGKKKTVLTYLGHRSLGRPYNFSPSEF